MASKKNKNATATPNESPKTDTAPEVKPILVRKRWHTAEELLVEATTARTTATKYRALAETREHVAAGIEELARIAAREKVKAARFVEAGNAFTAVAMLEGGAPISATRPTLDRACGELNRQIDEFFSI